MKSLAINSDKSRFSHGFYTTQIAALNAHIITIPIIPPIAKETKAGLKLPFINCIKTKNASKIPNKGAIQAIKPQPAVVEPAGNN